MAETAVMIDLSSPPNGSRLILRKERFTSAPGSVSRRARCGRRI
jgi:hypothetical protein